MIEVQNLTKQYGPFTAVNDVSFKVERGEILGFLGPNGAGKTTTMRVLTGYMPPTEGKAIVAGYDVLDQPLEAKRRTGLPARNAAALPRHDRARVPDVLRAHQGRAAGRAQNARGYGRWNAPASTTWPSATAASCRRATGSASAWRRRCSTIPDVLILDEPTAGLDPKQIIETRKLIKELAGDHTIVLSTHILPEVSQTCERVVIINKGRVVAVDSVDNLTARCAASTALYVQVDAAGPTRRGAAGACRGVTHGGARRHARTASADSRFTARPAGTSAATWRRPSSHAAGDCSSCEPSREPRGRVPPPHH